MIYSIVLFTIGTVILIQELPNFPWNSHFQDETSCLVSYRHAVVCARFECSIRKLVPHDARSQIQLDLTNTHLTVHVMDVPSRTIPKLGHNQAILKLTLRHFQHEILAQLIVYMTDKHCSKSFHLHCMHLPMYYYLHTVHQTSKSNDACAMRTTRDNSTFFSVLLRYGQAGVL